MRAKCKRCSLRVSVPSKGGKSLVRLGPCPSCGMVAWEEITTVKKVTGGKSA